MDRLLRDNFGVEEMGKIMGPVTDRLRHQPPRLHAFFAAFAFRRFGIVTSFFKLDEKSFFLALLLEDPHGLLKTILVGHFNFDHKSCSPAFLKYTQDPSVVFEIRCIIL